MKKAKMFCSLLITSSALRRPVPKCPHFWVVFLLPWVIIQRFLSQPFFVAEVFTGSPGKFVSLEDTIKGFKGIVAGEYDHLPENAFYMVGNIDEAVEKGRKMMEETN